MFMFCYHLNQNTSCNLKFVININFQPTSLPNHRRSEQPFYLPQVYPGVTPPMTPG